MFDWWKWWKSSAGFHRAQRDAGPQTDTKCLLQISDVAALHTEHTVKLEKAMSSSVKRLNCRSWWFSLRHSSWFSRRVGSRFFFFFYSRTILTLHRFVVTAGSDESDRSSWRRRINLICEKEAFQGLNSSCSHFLRPALQPPKSGEEDKWFYQADRGELSAPGWSGIKIITNIITWMSWHTDSSCQHGWSYQHLFILYLRRTTWRSCYLFKILGFLCDENVQTPKTKSLKLQNVPLNNHKSSKQSHRTVET